MLQLNISLFIQTKFMWTDRNKYKKKSCFRHHSRNRSFEFCLYSIECDSCVCVCVLCVHAYPLDIEMGHNEMCRNAYSLGILCVVVFLFILMIFVLGTFLCGFVKNLDGRFSFAFAFDLIYCCLHSAGVGPAPWPPFFLFWAPPRCLPPLGRWSWSDSSDSSSLPSSSRSSSSSSSSARERKKTKQTNRICVSHCATIAIGQWSDVSIA